MITILYGKNDISDADIEKNFSDYVISGSKESLSNLGLGVRENNPKALYYSALIFDKHIFIEAGSDKRIGKNLYKASIQEYRNTNNIDIVFPLHRLGMIYLKEKKYSKGIQLLEESSDLGFDKSTYSLIVFYEKEYFNSPKSLTKNRLNKIIQLYKKLLASKEFYSKALVGLARWYMNSPYDDFINYDLSLKYSLEAANEYHELEAYANLVTLYGYRNTPFKDINKSHYWQALYLSEGLGDD